MPTSAKQLIEAANAAVPKISGKEAIDMVANGAVLVDVRDSAELAQTGKAHGAVHIPRGSLEFKADPASPTVEKAFALDKPVILHCASGGRSALAGKLMKDFGYQKVYNLGGFKEWVDAGGKVDK
jgi:rhodanese-related sulfurtransferase